MGAKTEIKTFSMPAASERTKPVACPICGCGTYRLYWDCKSFVFSRCDGCGHVYQNPQPVFEDLKQRYADDYFAYEMQNEVNFFTLMKLGLADIAFEKREPSLKTLGPFLDIGCATGMLLDHMRGRGWAVQGVELCRESAEYGIAKRGLPIHIGPLEEASFPDSSFACVHFSHLIEHLNEPGLFLREVHRILKPGGTVIIVTPNIAGFQAQLLKQSWRSAIADHMHLFSRKGLIRIVQQSGFLVRNVKTWGGIAKGRAPAWLKWPLDRLAKRMGFGDVVLVEACKVSLPGRA